MNNKREGEIFPRLNSLTSTVSVAHSTPRRLPVASFCSWPSYRREATFLGTFAVLARLAWFHDDHSWPKSMTHFSSSLFFFPLSLSLSLSFHSFLFLFLSERRRNVSVWKIHSPITLTLRTLASISSRFFFRFASFFLWLIIIITFLSLSLFENFENSFFSSFFFLTSLQEVRKFDNFFVFFLEIWRKHRRKKHRWKFEINSTIPEEIFPFRSIKVFSIVLLHLETRTYITNLSL